MKYRWVLTILLGCQMFLSMGQEVSISPELSLRNYFSYHILGDIAGKSIVVRDRGYVKEFDVFNRDLELVQSSEIFLEKRRVDIFSVLEQDSLFQLVYGFFEKDSMVFNTRVYNNKIELIDSTEFLRLDKREIRKKIVSTVSEDKSRILLATVDEDDQLVFLLYNANTMSMEWSTKILLEDFDGPPIFHSAVLANNGDFLMAVNRDDWGSRAKGAAFLLVSPRSGFHQYVGLNHGEKSLENVLTRYDNRNNNWLICATYKEDAEKESQGFAYLLKPTSSFNVEEQFTYLPFPQEMYATLLQGKKKKNRVFDDLSIVDIVFRNDGGFILVSEIQREYTRRNPYNSYGRVGYDGYSSRRAWIDYYNDDIIVSNISGDGSLLWNRILYKKQFSQDDDGIYSSFFVMKTPSRLRFIYNDEIKRNNTVSEYLMDPAGQIARNSLLSTAYQKMKLRFQDAVQVSSNSLIVPSERSYDLNLVRITY